MNNFAYEKEKLPELTAILRRHAMSVVRFDVADSEQDTKQATDLTITLTGGAVGVRVRRYASTSNQYRDWTIRCRSQWGYATEIDKLRAGWGDFYLYAWEDADKRLTEYMLLDLAQVRSQGLLEPHNRYMAHPIHNKGQHDNTAFYAIPAAELIAHSCVVVHTIASLPGRIVVPSRAYLVQGIRATQAQLSELYCHLTGDAV